LENGANKNLDNWIRPNPIGAPITVITNNPPSKNVPNADKNPKKGMCQRMLPNVLIILFLFLFSYS